jgi:hypothetical protein
MKFNKSLWNLKKTIVEISLKIMKFKKVYEISQNLMKFNNLSWNFMIANNVKW